MADPQTPSRHPDEPDHGAPAAHVERKARLLLVLAALLVLASTAYLLYARGWFEPTQSLVLLTDDSEGVAVGMDMTFSGFPIGRVRRVALGPSGHVRITVDVAKKDAHWLRTSSVFTLVRGLVGGTAIRAFSGVLSDPPLPDGAERPVLRGDASADIPRVLGAAREVMENLNAMTAQDAALRQTLANLQAVSERARGPQGVAGAIFGNERDAKALSQALERTNTLLAKLDQMAAHADTQVFGPAGVMPEARAAMSQLQGLLAETRASLRRVDAVLLEAQAVGANMRAATTDLGPLRAEVESNLRKIEGLINDINRRWPFARDTEVKLP